MQSPHLVSPHHFVHSPLLLTLSVVVTTPLIPHRLQADNSALRDGTHPRAPKGNQGDAQGPNRH